MRPSTAVLAVCLCIALAAVPAPVAAQDRTGTTIIVESGETVDGFTATGATVIVRGTVEGDLRAYAGSVVVEENGTVTGRLRAYAGTVRIAGTVGDTAVAYGGTVTLAETGVVRGSLGAAAADVELAGTVRGDVTAGAATVRVAPTAHVTGDLNYDGDLTVAPGARIEGETRHIDDLNVGPAPPSLPPGTFLLYGVLSQLLAGALLLRVLPDVAADLRDRATADPLRTVGTGVVALVVVAVSVVLLAVTIVGLPLAVSLLFVALGLGWVGTVYGRYVVGAWLVARAGEQRRWVGLLVGVLAVALLSLVPVLGPLVRLVVGLLGVGALGHVVRDRYRSASSGGLGGRY